MLSGMAPTKKKPLKPPKSGEEGDFRSAFATLLKSRKLSVPRGLASAPPEAYASQPASLVEQLSKLSDTELKRFAEQVGGYAKRQQARAKAAWDASPLIAELRRRRLAEPAPPSRVVGASVSLSKPLAEWSDKEILRAATDWSRLGAT